MFNKLIPRPASPEILFNLPPNLPADRTEGRVIIELIKAHLLDAIEIGEHDIQSIYIADGVGGTMGYPKLTDFIRTPEPLLDIFKVEITYKSFQEAVRNTSAQ